MFKGIIKSLAKWCGFEIVGHPRAYAARRSLAGLLRQEQINLVLDVGANTGQFVEELRAAGYGGRIVSFEPLASAHAKLRKHAEGDPNWTIADRTAIGAETGSVDIHVSENSVSSSILDMLPSHSQADPQSRYMKTETVPVNRLDDLISLARTDRALLKLDVQGYERQVLDGAKHVLADCRAVISEMSLIPMYDGELLAREIWDLLAAQNFEAWSLEACFRNPENGRVLQLDGLFVRESRG
jgi:FkbM family methyltransferase